MWTNLSYLLNRVHHSDCVAFMKTLPDNCIDSIVTDPPYELWFMGKSWDNTGIANSIEMRGECLRILKPWGHLLSFSGTRTYHRMACAIEDAGFEVRDMIEWVYGSGFPKSLNVSKQLKKQWHTEEAKEWIWRGTSIKPAHEPVCMARKPLGEKTVAENCLKYGTGGINIDESRVGTTAKETQDREKWNKYANKEYDNGGTGYGEKITKTGENSLLGRFPANLLHDNSEEVRECFPETGKGNGKGAYNYAGREYNNKETSIFNGDKPHAPSNFNDSGNASRFFKSILYYPKASKGERKLEDGNYSTHPTVKPIALMEYLIKMVTKEWGIVFDPFTWSWTTLVAAKKNWFQYLGTEMTDEYIPIIEARLNATELEEEEIIDKWWFG